MLEKQLKTSSGVSTEQNASQGQRENPKSAGHQFALAQLAASQISNAKYFDYSQSALSAGRGASGDK
jgi:hypothetical protein